MLETLRGWLPRRMYRNIRKWLDREPVSTIIVVKALIDYGRPIIQEAEESEAPADHKPDRITWDGAFAEYLTTYGGTLNEMLEMEWGAWLHLYRNIPKQHARQQLRSIEASLMPWTEQKTRKRILRKLREVAGWIRKLTREQLLAQQEQALGMLTAAWEKVYKHNPRA